MRSLLSAAGELLVGVCVCVCPLYLLVNVWYYEGKKTKVEANVIKWSVFPILRKKTSWQLCKQKSCHRKYIHVEWSPNTEREKSESSHQLTKVPWRGIVTLGIPSVTDISNSELVNSQRKCEMVRHIPRSLPTWDLEMILDDERWRHVETSGGSQGAGRSRLTFYL